MPGGHLFVCKEYHTKRSMINLVQIFFHSSSVNQLDSDDEDDVALSVISQSAAYEKAKGKRKR